MSIEDLQERIASAAQRTWQAIGGDILRAVDKSSMPRDEVIEAVIDYIGDYGGDKEAVAAFGKLSFAKKKKVLREVFPLARYGW